MSYHQSQGLLLWLLARAKGRKAGHISAVGWYRAGDGEGHTLLSYGYLKVQHKSVCEHRFAWTRSTTGLTSVISIGFSGHGGMVQYLDLMTLMIFSNLNDPTILTRLCRDSEHWVKVLTTFCSCFPRAGVQALVQESTQLPPSRQSCRVILELLEGWHCRLKYTFVPEVLEVLKGSY